MKKVLMYIIFISIILILSKFYLSNYKIEYNINNYKIKEVYNDSRYYFEITNDKTYNFDIYKKRTLKKHKINDIKIIEKDNIFCIVPTSKDIKTYPLCYVDEVYTDYNLINIEELDEYKTNKISVEKPKNDFIYYDNLNNNEYVALWNYKGYIVMHNNTYKYIELFKKDKYDNTLAYMIDNTIYMANYEEEHEYTKLIKFNVETYKQETIELKNSIDYDSYIVGHIKKKLYIFDNKHSILYEINLKNNKVKVVGNNSIGFKKYENGEFINCSKTEYKINKIKYNKKESIYNYTIDNGLYKIIEENKLKQKILNNEVKIIGENKNEIYYTLNDEFYKYTPSYGNEKIFYNYELAYNNDNSIFIYIK